jgi:hypothetical protein
LITLNGTQPNVSVEENLTFDGTTLFVNREVYPTRYIETYVNLDNVSVSANIDLETGNNFYARVTGDTTFTFSNPPASGQGFGFTLLLKVAGPFPITWPNTIKWPSDITPSVTGDDIGVDIFVFYTYDSGATYYGLTGGLNLS